MICDDCFDIIITRQEDGMLVTTDGISECSHAYDGLHSPAKCLDGGREDCEGLVDLWWSGGTYGKSWPRCTKHGEARLERYENSMEIYADSDCVPDWFDEANAGERWEADY